MPLYLSYGSNMDAARFAERTGADAARIAGRIGVAINGMRLAFQKRNDDGTAFATLLPDHAGRAEGVGYEVTGEELARLDAAEGVPEHYLRAVVEVVPLLGGPARSAVTYLANPARCSEGLLPPRWYVEHFLEAAALLSPGWVAMLRAQEVAG